MKYSLTELRHLSTWAKKNADKLQKDMSSFQDEKEYVVVRRNSKRITKLYNQAMSDRLDYVLEIEDVENKKRDQK